MAQSAAFRWDKRARLFAGMLHVPRDYVVASQDFAAIAAQPTRQALTRLGAALLGGSGFCIADDAVPSEVHVTPQDFLTLTGGSSGHPKIIRRTQLSWMRSFAVNADHFSLTPDDTVAVFGKLSHSLALYGVLEGLHLGLDTCALGDMQPKTQRTAISAADATVLYATPTQLRLLARGAYDETLLSVRLILCGGGALDTTTRAAAQMLCPKAAIHVFYGASETSFITLSDAGTPAGAVGRPYPGVDLRILDARGLPTKDVGEVWVQSPYLFEGYVTGSSAHTRWQGGFVTVGEMGQLDAGGNLWLKGRGARMVTIADQNVFPEDIEVLISTWPEFSLCAVIPVLDKLRGHRLIAVLEGVQDSDVAQALKQKCAAKLGAQMTPAKVLFHPRIPLLNSGKVDLVALTKWVGDQL